MKYITSILFLTLLFILGCEQMTEINSPASSLEGRVVNKKLIKLPPSSGLIGETQTFNQNIYGPNGGEFQRSYTYQTSSGGSVYQFADLDFDPGAFSGTQNISMTFNLAGAAMDFGPPMQFQAPVEYTYKITGIDVSGINPATLEFVYIDANGDMYTVDYDYVEVDPSIGMLKVKDAVLPHFSRYGFVN